MLIPTDIAHQILATFGITKPTPAYDRWMRDDGVLLDDFDEILFASPFIFSADWRDALHDAIPPIVAALQLLDVDLSVELVGEDGTEATVSHNGKSTLLRYETNDDGDFNAVIQSLQSLLTTPVSFRASPSNDGSDTLTFAVLPDDEWAELDSIAPDVIRHFFAPLSQNRG